MLQSVSQVTTLQTQTKKASDNVRGWGLRVSGGHQTSNGKPTSLLPHPQNLSSIRVRFNNKTNRLVLASQVKKGCKFVDGSGTE